jgi:hypothetical protein
VSCLTRASQNESWSHWPPLLQSHIIKLHNSKVNEKVKQAVPPFEWAPPNRISFSSLVKAIYSSILNCTLQPRRGKE